MIQLFRVTAMSIILLGGIRAYTQEIYSLDLAQSIEIAKEKSYTVLMLQQNLKVAEYNLKAATNRFRTNVDLIFSAPNYSETITDYSDTSGIHYYPIKNLSYSGELLVNQPLPTDGRIYLSTGIRNRDDFYQDEKSVRFNTRLGFSQPIEAFYAYNSLKAEYQRAELNYELSFKGLKRAELELVYQISNAFYSVLSAKERMEIALQDLKRQEDVYTTAKNKYDAGLIRETEALQMEIDLGAAQNSLDIARVNYEARSDVFKQQIGISLQDSVSISGDYDYTEIIVDEEKAVQLGLENRLEIREHEIEIALAGLEIKRRKADGMINGEITAYYDLIGVGYNPLGTPMDDAFADTWQDMNNRPGNKGVALSINVPLIDWGVNESRVKAAKALQQREKYNLELNKVDIEREIRSTVSQLQSSLRRLQLLEKNVEVAGRNFEISKARFTNGDIDAQTLALDRARLNNANISYLEAYISYKLLIADLARKTFYDFEKQQVYSYDSQELD